MKFNQLNLTSFKNQRRRGRGIAAGLGKTAGRGTKGQKSRSGGRTRPYFEGGQTPLVRRLPKLAGFRSHRPKAQTVYTEQLDQIKTTSKIIDNHVLFQQGLIDDEYRTVKIISKGQVSQAHQVQVQRISKTALNNIQQAGGDFKKISRPQRPNSTKKTERQQARLKNRQATRKSKNSKLM
ncbi:MAG: 50S ribosomal protein L15 [Candidatus Saccharibacteria bacterium]|nr:50S ribosomal protein L15 [Candidatus Saccharibacteria bacterium]MCY4089062.1 50S ribosomal protein L15 [Candidatus Saccharibacteria bacterium]